MSTRKKTGRPTVRTQRRARIICNALARGLPACHACACAGISFMTFSTWRTHDDKFRQRIEAAIAKGIDRRLKKIEKASADDWRASAWLLEHCPGAAEHFSKSRVEVTGPDGESLPGAQVAVLVWPHMQTSPTTQNEKFPDAEENRPALATPGAD
jgi:hypothetical protein